MTGQQLKNSILQMAVQGKLVPQDPNDEPASVLLERIRKEKEQLIKDGKIKKEKNPSIIFRGADNLPYEQVGKNEPVCIADAVPFDIPDSWEWCRVKNICNVVSARRVHQSDWRSSGIPFYRAREIGKLADSGYVNNELFITEELYDEFSKNGVPKCGDLMVTAVGTLGKTYIVKANDKFYYKDASVICFENFSKMVPEYLQLLMMSPYLTELIKSKSTGTTVGTITIVTANEYLIPVPPLNEQFRIIEKLNELQPFVENYTRSEERLDNLNSSFPGALKKSILQQAVMGKLVPQDENDEPASVLLERIRAEKQKLVAEGKIKKDKNESVIFRRDNSHYEKLNGIERCIDDEIPFEIPNNWCWVRLGTISTYAQKKEKINAQNASPNIWELDLEDIEKGGKLLKKSNVSERKAVGDKTMFYKGNILYSKLRPYLLKIFVADENGICTPEIVPFDTYCNIYNEYIATYLKSPYVDNFINTITYGVKMPRVGTETMVDLFVPLPPVEEQHRIVATYKSILPALEQL